MDARLNRWSSESICLQFNESDLPAMAKAIYQKTCRIDFSQPGFCVVNLGSEMDSKTFRRWMVQLKDQMSLIHQERSGSGLAYLSAARFDQQETTRLHLDGGPEQCFLMLGYEPSAIESELEIADYAQCAFDMNLSPQEFMAKHNPMFQAGLARLKPYITRIPCFRASDFQIVCINNSSTSYSQIRPAWQGTLHTAEILTPDESQRRVINSTMIAVATEGVREIDPELIKEFVSTSTVRRRGYDKTHLQDD